MNLPLQINQEVLPQLRPFLLRFLMSVPPSANLALSSVSGPLYKVEK
jgi:hypothetical protein